MASSQSGTGKGDSRPPGPEGEGDDIIPRWERWELRFNARDLKSYASQLEFFKIELAAIGAGHTQVDYVSNLTGSPQKRSGSGEEEKRLYFMNRREGPLLKYETSLLAKGGVPMNGRLVLKLIPKDLEDRLALLEKEYAVKKRGKDVTTKELAKTVFECHLVPRKAFSGRLLSSVTEHRASDSSASGESHERIKNPLGAIPSWKT